MKGEVPASNFFVPTQGNTATNFWSLGEAPHHCEGDQLLIGQMFRLASSLQADRYERQDNGQVC
jgi:hypothetical protein